MKDILEFVNKAHQGQMRRQEEPYVNHAVRVAKMCAALFGTGSAVRVALLHDVVEDTDFGFEECFQYLQDQKEKEALELLTKRVGETSK